MIIYTVPLLWHVQKFQFLAKVKATSTGKLLDSLPRNNAVVELVNSMWLTVVIRNENYQHHHHHTKIASSQLQKQIPNSSLSFENN
jgi:hypothetical protein